MVYFDPETLGFIPESWKNDGTYSVKSWPSSAVLLSKDEELKFWKVSPPEGKYLGSKNSRPFWSDIPKIEKTKEEIESLRLSSYADPLTGSDRLFSESTRMQIIGENGYEEVRARAIARFEEIQAQYPWTAK